MEELFKILGLIGFGTIIGIVIQHFLNKGRLKTEREFLFKKEQYFCLKIKFEEIIKIMIEIDDYLFDKNIKTKSFSDILYKISLIESLIGVYFSDIKEKYYTPYMNAISSYTDNNENLNLKMDIGNKKEILIGVIRKKIIENEKNL